MIEDKYPENYFEHYIACFLTTHRTPDQAGFDSLARLYVDIEGIDTFRELILEIEPIKGNNDFPYLMDAVERFEIKGLDEAGLEAMAETAISVYREMTTASS